VLGQINILGRCNASLHIQIWHFWGNRNTFSGHWSFLHIHWSLELASSATHWRPEDWPQSPLSILSLTRRPPTRRPKYSIHVRLS